MRFIKAALQRLRNSYTSYQNSPRKQALRKYKTPINCQLAFVYVSKEGREFTNDELMQLEGIRQEILSLTVAKSKVGYFANIDYRRLAIAAAKVAGWNTSDSNSITVNGDELFDVLTTGKQLRLSYGELGKYIQTNGYDAMVVICFDELVRKVFGDQFELEGAIGLACLEVKVQYDMIMDPPLPVARHNHKASRKM